MADNKYYLLYLQFTKSIYKYILKPIYMIKIFGIKLFMLQHNK